MTSKLFGTEPAGRRYSSSLIYVRFLFKLSPDVLLFPLLGSGLPSSPVFIPLGIAAFSTGVGVPGLLEYFQPLAYRV